jgi:hypothetical protein
MTDLGGEIVALRASGVTEPEICVRPSLHDAPGPRSALDVGIAAQHGCGHG